MGPCNSKADAKKKGEKKTQEESVAKPNLLENTKPEPTKVETSPTVEEVIGEQKVGEVAVVEIEEVTEEAKQEPLPAVTETSKDQAAVAQQDDGCAVFEGTQEMEKRPSCCSDAHCEANPEAVVLEQAVTTAVEDVTGAEAKVEETVANPVEVGEPEVVATEKADLPFKAEISVRDGDGASLSEHGEESKIQGLETDDVVPPSGAFCKCG